MHHRMFTFASNGGLRLVALYEGYTCRSRALSTMQRRIVLRCETSDLEPGSNRCQDPTTFLRHPGKPAFNSTECIASRIKKRRLMSSRPQPDPTLSASMSIATQYGILSYPLTSFPWISVGAFNLLKYVLMTYLIGIIWDIAHIRAVEMKRYLSLWYTGQFSVATWGRSRNNLFSGSNFETVCAELRRRFCSPNEQTNEQEDAPVQNLDNELSNLRCLFIEVLSIGLIILVVFAEGTSELFTDSRALVTYSFENRTSTARVNSSEILYQPRREYSVVSDVLYTRMCTRYEGSRTFVNRPNFIVESGEFYPSHSVIPTYNLSLLCRYDENNPDSTVEVHHTFIEPQKNPLDLDNGKRETFTNDNVQHKYYFSRFLGEITIPHFSKASAVGSIRLEHKRLWLFDIDGVNYTCTQAPTWCIRDTGDDYEVIYGACEGGCTGTHERRSIDVDATMFLGVKPFRISHSTLPMLATDPFMMRPAREGNSLRDIEENVYLLALGYTFGWTKQELRNQSVIVDRKMRIIPTIQIGYLVCVSVIVICSFLVISFHAVFSRRRIITGLVGEHAFIDRWHGHLRRDGMCDRIQGRTNIMVFGSYPGVGHLQPAVALNAIPLSQIEIMK